jgi:hypothetical protein
VTGPDLLKIPNPSGVRITVTVVSLGTVTDSELSVHELRVLILPWNGWRQTHNGEI